MCTAQWKTGLVSEIDLFARIPIYRCLHLISKDGRTSDDGENLREEGADIHTLVYAKFAGKTNPRSSLNILFAKRFVTSGFGVRIRTVSPL